MRHHADVRNAKTGGLEKDFNLTSTQYSIVLLVFFVSDTTRLVACLTTRYPMSSSRSQVTCSLLEYDRRSI